MAAKTHDANHWIDPKRAREHAWIGAIQGPILGLDGTASWLSGAVSRTPLTIHDVNGEPLFYDFSVESKLRVQGTVRTTASELLGNPVVALELGPRAWSFEAALRKVRPRAKKAAGKRPIIGTKLVCYSYPKLGVMFELQGTNGIDRLIYDVADLASISLETAQEQGKYPREGSFAWSFFDSLDAKERGQRLKLYRRIDAQLSRHRKQLASARSVRLLVDSDLLEILSRVITVRLPFCSHYGAEEARSHHCFVLHAQQVNDYCAVATCQMILCYYRYSYAQNNIAPALGYSPGGCPSDQSPGYESLTCNHLQAAFDTAPTWAKGRDQINLRRPFKSGIPGHARACAGYSSSILSVIGSTQKLYIYDPWPWNADLKQGGAVYWETWSSITHTNYVTAGIDCTP